MLKLSRVSLYSILFIVMEKAQKHKRFDKVYPYTYCLKRNSDGFQYHGVRIQNVKLNKTPIEDFGVSYFSSGKFKIEFRTHPNNFEWKLRWTFDNANDALLYETKINEELHKRQNWINSCGKYFPIETSKIAREKFYLLNHGVKHNSQIPSVILKRKNTFVENFGVDNPSKHESIKEKKKQTF